MAEIVTVVSLLVSSVAKAAIRARTNKRSCAELSRKCALVETRLKNGELEFSTDYRKNELVNAILECNVLIRRFKSRGSLKRLLLSGEVDDIISKHSGELDKWLAFAEEGLSEQDLLEEHQKAERLRWRVSQRLDKGIASLKSQSTVLASKFPILIQNLHIDEQIGKFPFGIIKKGTYDGKPVYIREISDEVTPDQLDYMLRSIHLSNCLSKDCGVSHVIGVCRGRMFVTKATTHGPLSEYSIADDEQKVDIAYKIADALMAVHDVKTDTECVVHRDIRAENILINLGPGEDEELEPFITGFEICKQNRDPTGERPEIPEYYRKWWSPQRIKGEQSSPESDVYAFGVLMYEISTGQEPESESADLVALEGERICKEYTALMKRCLFPGNNSRPSMSTVAEELESIKDLLLLSNRREA